MRFDASLHYLDNAATTMVSPAVADAVSEAMKRYWANPSSLYTPAVEAEQALEKARAQVAKSMGCAPRELYFTACGSESNNLAILGQAIPRQSWGDKVVTTGFEHPSVQRPIRALRERGFTVAEVPPRRDGTLDEEAFLAAVDSRTVLAACMAVNNETGAKQDIARLAAGVKAKNGRTVFHVDAVQAWLRIPLSLKNVDSMAVSGHKVHAPKGVGALYLKNAQNFKPPYLGGHQERGVRPGTENLPYAVGLGAAAREGAKTLTARAGTVMALNTQLRAGLKALPGITINSPADAVPEVLNFSTGCVNSQTMIEWLDGKSIYVSGGSACDKGEPSHTLLAMGCEDALVRTALRVSFCADNTGEDVDALLDALEAGLKTLQHR